MPPKGHSSSSHSSSHHSSSSHRSSSSSHRSSSSSSRSSSSYSRSSFSSSSRPSSHSSSSHSSYSSSSKKTSGSSRPSSHSETSHSSYSYSSAPKRTVRTRRNQPIGFIPSMESNVVKTYYCKKHDYVYYPNDWTSEDGNEHKAGYYDEEGTHYKTIAFEDREVLLTCEYCGTQKKLVWKTGSAPICDNCGATLTIDTTDTIEDIDSNLSNNNSSNNYCSNTNYGHGYENIYLSIVSALLIIGTISFLIPVLNSRTDIAKQTFIESQDTTNYNNSNDFVFESSDDSRSSNYIYVDEIGRTCFKDGEDFYDDETECWFYFNESLYPAQWQYWFESVSGNYGDYGWMEYDDNEQRWYIEVDDGNWQVLPEEEYTDDLWHFDNAFQY